MRLRLQLRYRVTFEGGARSFFLMLAHMDPPPEERTRLFNDAFRALVESSPPLASEIQASNLVRRVEAPRI